MLSFFLLLLLHQVQQQEKARADCRPDAGQENNTGRIAAKIEQQPSGQQEHSLGTLQTGPDQILVMAVIPGRTVRSHGELGEEQDERNAHHIKIGCGQHRDFRAASGNNTHGKGDTGQIQAAEIAFFNLAFQHIADTRHYREQPVADVPHPEGGTQDDDIVPDAVPGTGGTVEHAADEQHPQQAYDPVDVHSHKGFQPQGDKSPQQGAPLTPRFRIHFPADEVGEEEAGGITNAVQHDAARAAPRYLTEDQQKDRGNQRAYDGDPVKPVIKIERPAQTEILVGDIFLPYRLRKFIFPFSHNYVNTIS